MKRPPAYILAGSIGAGAAAFIGGLEGDRLHFLTQEPIAYMLPPWVSDRAYEAICDGIFSPGVAGIGIAATLVAFGKLTGPADRETRCRQCGYLLRGLSELRCPECGEAI